MAKKHINPTLSAVVMECETDEDLRDTIQLLKGELGRRQRRRQVNRLQRIIDTLSRAEKKALCSSLSRHGVVVADENAVTSLKTAKLAFQGTGGVAHLVYTTATGKHMARILKTQE